MYLHYCTDVTSELLTQSSFGDTPKVAGPAVLDIRLRRSNNKNNDDECGEEQMDDATNNQDEHLWRDAYAFDYKYRPEELELYSPYQMLMEYIQMPKRKVRKKSNWLIS